MTDEADYVTVNPAVPHDRWCVVLMKWDHTLQEYVVFRCSDPLKKPAAEALALSWGAASHLEIR